MALFLHVFIHTLQISLSVMIMMVLIDFIDVKSRGRFKDLMRGGPLRQYLATAFLGATPGCLGAFMSVSMYVHGFLSFGAITAGMIATSGDEAFVMLARFPREALLLFALLFALAIPLGWTADFLARIFNFQPCRNCRLHQIHEPQKEHSWSHYLRVHIWQHIIRRHVWRIFWWTLLALSAVEIGLHYWSLENLVTTNPGWVLILAALIGIIPQSGPHLIIVMLFADGLTPFSVLLTSAIAQDGHGLLPLLSYSFRDSVLIKLFNVIAALLVGGLAYALGF
ncbi:MAG: arsenic efflux protein [Calditrichaeota bacterium]|nr:arsenic efflux protein [Calditrichota bacterium]